MRNLKFWLKWLLLPAVLLLLWCGWQSESVVVDASGSTPPMAIPAHPAVHKSESTGSAQATNTSGVITNNDSTASAATKLDSALCVTADAAEQQLRQILQQRKQQSYLLIQQLLQSGTKTPDVATIIHQLGGDMVPFAGYELPVLYKGSDNGGVMKEHLWCRSDNGASLFDVSHMGQVRACVCSCFILSQL